MTPAPPRMIRLPSAIQLTSDRELAVLRALGRLGVVRMSDLLSLVLVARHTDYAGYRPISFSITVS